MQIYGNFANAANSADVCGRRKRNKYFDEIIERLPQILIYLSRANLENYVNLLEAVSEASGLRISYDTGTLEIMTLSTEHENYGRLLQMMIGNLCIHLRMEIISFGSATIKKSRFEKGTEPDACFYIQTAAQIGSRINLDSVCSRAESPSRLICTRIFV